MEAITEKVITTAMNHLKGAGCRYYVIDKEGQQYFHGIDPDQLRLKRTRGAARGPRKDWSGYGHIEKIKTMAVGDVLQFTPKEGDEPEGLRKVVSSGGHNLFGAGNFATTITNGVVEIIRLA